MNNRIGIAVLAGWAALAVQAADFKFMTFNIKNGGDQPDWNNRKAQVFNLVRNNAPDVVGMQEVLKYQLDELLAALPGYAALGVGRNDGRTAGEYSPIFYKTSLFRMDTSATFWLSNTPEVPGSMAPTATHVRIDTWARLRHIPSNRTFYFHSSHWDLDETARVLGAHLIAQRIRDRRYPQDPVVFTCDCNSTSTGNPVRYMMGQNGSPITFYTAYEKLYPNDANSATANGFTGVIRGKPIDHIMSFDSIPVLNASILRDHVGTKYPSDHYPVLATLRIATPVALRPSTAHPAEFRAMKRFPGVLFPVQSGKSAVDAGGRLCKP